MTKLVLKAGHKWILELLDRVERETDLRKAEKRFPIYKQFVKKKYGYNLGIMLKCNTLERFAVLGMSDQKATLFIMQYGDRDTEILKY